MGWWEGMTESRPTDEVPNARWSQANPVLALQMQQCGVPAWSWHKVVGGASWDPNHCWSSVLDIRKSSGFNGDHVQACGERREDVTFWLELFSIIPGWLNASAIWIMGRVRASWRSLGSCLSRADPPDTLAFEIRVEWSCLARAK